MGHSGSLDVLNKRISGSPSVSRNTQKFGASVDINLANDGYSTSIFSKLLGRELPDSISANIYSLCWMDFMSNAVRTEAPNFVDLGLPAVNTLYEFNTFGTPDIRFIRPTCGFHWSAPGHVFGEAKLVGMSGTISEQNYIHKTDFEIWKEN